MGGPTSKYYDGWFAELYADSDKVKSKNSTEETKNLIIKIIENKVIRLQGETTSFLNYKYLTPAFWLDVPKDWENIQK
jgi:hypothetical protein